MSTELDVLLKSFVDLTETELLQISSCFTRKTVKKGKYVLRAGEVCKDLIFVNTGCIRMYYLSDGVEVSAWFSLKNSLAMEVQSFISQSPSICYLEAIEDSEIFTLSKTRLEGLYVTQAKSQELMRKIWEAALVLIIPRFSSLQNDTAEKRYLDLMQNPDLIRLIPQKYLASFIGVTPTSLSRIRKKMRSAINCLMASVEFFKPCNFAPKNKMKVLLFGASGNLGQSIAKELNQRGYDITCVVRNKQKAAKLELVCRQIIVADVTQATELVNICEGFDVVISSLGKSVSPNDKSRPGFNDIDFIANSNILSEAKKSGVKKFVYISALHAERYLHLEYFKVHHLFSEKLILSGIDYSIIKPPAIFSAFVDMIEMAKKGNLITIGSGDKKTNPIFEGDLAKITVDSIGESKKTIEAGGKNIYTRRQLNEIIQQSVAPGKTLRHVPLVVFKCLLPCIKLVNKNTFDKFAFFVEVMQHDTVAPGIGNMSFEEYIRLKK